MGASQRFAFCLLLVPAWLVEIAPAGQVSSFELQRLLHSDASSGDFFGRSVAIDEEVIAVGAYFDFNAQGFAAGAVYIFRFNGIIWEEEAKLTASDGEENDFFGFTVALDGDVLIVGAHLDDDITNGEAVGSAYIFRYNPGTGMWNQEQKLQPLDPGFNDQFGYSVGISGNTAVIGAYSDDLGVLVDAGSAYVFRFNGFNWLQEQKLTAPDASLSDKFGWAVDVSGGAIVCGASGDSHAGGIVAGSAYVFHFTGLNWVFAQQLIASDSSLLDRFGSSVAIQNATIAVGAPAKLTDTGAAYIFRFNGAAWMEEQRLFPQDPEIHDGFGFSIDVEEDPILGRDVAVVGTRYGDEGGTDSGAAYFFQFDGLAGMWLPEMKLAASDGNNQDEFGISIAVSSRVTVVGSWLADTACPALPDCDSGAAYVFSASGDCNGNLIPDAADLLNGTSLDCNNNGTLDECDGPGVDCRLNGIPEPCGQDFDADGIRDGCDNCPMMFNPAQANTDNDAFGDGCDPCPFDHPNDIDFDGVCTSVDNCPTVFNPGQEDNDGDLLGDACDPFPLSFLFDQDDDGIENARDNCATRFNPLQEDLDVNGIGDDCDGCFPHGDTDWNRIVDLDDIMCVLERFSDSTKCPLGDIAPCSKDGQVDVDDIVAILNAFGGDSNCVSVLCE